MIKNKANSIDNIILIGNPNTGKSSLFNSLTGLKQKVGNFHGVTVEKKIGKYSYNNKDYNVVDLPGTYGLKANSEDEKVALEYIENTSENDLIVVVADVIHLKRNLRLFYQIKQVTGNVVLVLNMMDLLEKANLEVNLTKLSQLLCVPVIPMNARISKGIEEFKLEVSQLDKSKLSLFSGDINKQIDEVVSNCLVRKGENTLSQKTKKIDHILTHSVFGYIFFLGLLFLIFQAIFSWASYPMDFIDETFVALCSYLQEILPPGKLSDLLINGVLAGIGGIIIFIPQITILYAIIGVLEDTGYMARVSFLMDKMLRPFGLNGKSIIPLISSAACAVPAIMSTRTIPNVKEKLITILVAPLISCSARIPVYTLLIAMLVPAEKTLGIFNVQGLLMMGLYLIGFISALLSALVFKLIIKVKSKGYFIMELPIYRVPRWKNVGFETLSKVKVFLFDAGKIIIAISIVLWVLSSYGPSNEFQKIEEKYTELAVKEQKPIEHFKVEISTEKLASSYAGIIGKTIEPVIKPIGFDWKIGIALVTSFAAREVFVGTMATLYSVEDGDNTTSLKEKLKKSVWVDTGQKVYTTATILSLLMFYVFAMQCMATLAIVKRETNSWLWPIVQLVYLGILAYGSSWIVYNIFNGVTI